MPTRLPLIETDRLVIRDFLSDDLADVHRMLDLEIDPATGKSLEQRRQWLDWCIQSYEQLASLHQPPYGDRAITLRGTGTLVGAIGYAAMFHPIAQVLNGISSAAARWLPEIGLYWALAPAQRGNGFATEAAQALIDHAFTNFNLKRIVANTGFANTASQQVMRRLGMTLYRNTTGQPEWYEVLGVLEQK